jgi:hypothetical protein
MKMFGLSKILDFLIEKGIECVIVKCGVDSEVDLIEGEVKDGEVSVAVVSSIDMES